MILYEYFIRERTLIRKSVNCKETSSRYTPDKSFSHIAMSYVLKENIGKVVGIYKKSVFLKEANDLEAKEAFKSYYSSKKKRLEEILKYKKKKIDDIGKMIESFNGMEVIEK